LKSHLFKNATGKAPHPLEFKILSALRYLGQGWTFDDCPLPLLATHCVTFSWISFAGVQTIFFRSMLLNQQTTFVQPPPPTSMSLAWQDCMVVLRYN
jgi:hypothetical protein